MFVDASALVAMLCDEPEARSFAARIDRSEAPVTSAIAVYEAVLALSRAFQVGVETALDRVHGFLNDTGIRIVDVGRAEADAALDAHARFGKGRHPARLNMGDCFAYACARTRGVPLLYKGEDFALTDVQAG